VAPKKIPANARVMVRNGRGDITVRGSDSAEIRVTAKKMCAPGANGCAADRRADQCDDRADGDGYEVASSGYDLSNSRIGVDLEVPSEKIGVVDSNGQATSRIWNSPM